MTVPTIQTSLASGEVAPSLYGRPDLARFHSAAGTMRNMFVFYAGGGYSRAGLGFVGFNRQTGRNYPPKFIPFQFSISQGLVLEFGNYYLRIISNGAYVTENPVAITALTNASPAVATVSFSNTASATPNNGGVVQSYAPGELVTLAGGTYTSPAVLLVSRTLVLSAVVSTPGVGNAVPGDVLTMGGGAIVSAPTFTVSHTQLGAIPTIAAAGAACANGPATVTGTTGTGTKFQCSVTIAGGIITAVNSIVFAGDYTANPAVLANEPVTGAGLVGAQLSIVMGVKTATLTTAGVFSANPAGSILTQTASTGTGTGCKLYAQFAPQAVTISSAGAYTATPANPVAQLATSGTGLGATFNVTWSSGAAGIWNTGDWIALSAITGMPAQSGQTVVVTQLTPTTYALRDVFGSPIDTTTLPAYVGGSTGARIYTPATPYSEVDIPWLKYEQDKDVMSLTCVNPDTATEYPPYDLTRYGNTDWRLIPWTVGATIAAPGYPGAVATGTGTVNYAYCVTAVAADGSESIASQAVFVGGAIDIHGTAGSITITWPQVSNAIYYNVYKASPCYGSPVPPTALFGFAGSSYGTRFVDSNVTATLTQVPPLHRNPFARGQIVAASILASTSDFTSASLSVATSSGSDSALIVNVATTLAQTGGGQNSVSPGPCTSVTIQNPGHDYAPGDYAVISGDGAAANASITIGPQSGTYPSVVSYFLQRRVAANTLNEPNTYWMSQPGAYLNFDTRIPSIDSDAITGSPWSQQVNGIQWMVQTTPGLIVMTGSSAWLLPSPGSFATTTTTFSPSHQTALRQAFSGSSALVRPISINYSLIYLERNSSLYYELPYQLYALSEPIDRTQNSIHLFHNYTFVTHSWCEQPFKTLWAVRDDGVLLSLTYLKEQAISGWARHDTQGKFVQACSIVEPPVDALYVATQRTINGHLCYMTERMDNRNWSQAEDAVCVDASVQLANPTPAAILTANSATGLGACTGVSNLVGGANYSAFTTAQIVDDNGKGPGTGASATLTIVGGVITGVTLAPGIGYVAPAISVTDPTGTGSGFSATVILDNSATFTASAAVFAGSLGYVIRMGEGIAVVTQVVSPLVVIADILQPITMRIPETGLPAPQPAGSWSLTEPVTKVYAPHLAGMLVTGLADGNVIPPVVAAADGGVVLPAAASKVVIGLGYTVQLQSIYVDTGDPTIQGQRKKIASATFRVESSRGFEVGANQIDASTQNPPTTEATWYGMSAAPNKAVKPYNALCEPLFTGDVWAVLQGGYATPGQVAIQQRAPLPLQVLAIVDNIQQGDTPEVRVTPRPQEKR